MTSELLEVRVSAVFDYWAAYVGGEKIKIDGLKRHTWTDVITHSAWILIRYVSYSAKNKPNPAQFSQFKLKQNFNQGKVQKKSI